MKGQKKRKRYFNQNLIGKVMKMKRNFGFLIGLAVLSGILVLSLTAPLASARQPLDERQVESKNLTGVLLGILLAVGIAGVSSAFGLVRSGSAAAAVTGEKPELGMKLMILEVLPMTQVLYGLVAAILLMMGCGLLGGKPGVDLTNPIIGNAGLIAGLIVGITGISALAQGTTAAASIAAVGREPRAFAPSMIYIVMVETVALFGLVTAIFVMFGFGFL
jgi:V/A-type H+-transporting ATPase subunit K